MIQKRGMRGWLTGGDIRWEYRKRKSAKMTDAILEQQKRKIKFNGTSKFKVTLL